MAGATPATGAQNRIRVDAAHPIANKQGPSGRESTKNPRGAAPGVFCVRVSVKTTAGRLLTVLEKLGEEIEEILRVNKAVLVEISAINAPGEEASQEVEEVLRVHGAVLVEVRRAVDGDLRSRRVDRPA